ncbi:hypothetical protein Cgig2_013672 [Carnegiea gigantea]|uniref:Uncharacterized protein n=1 Tax=Carnegiea gigantea TaxID=171969 RepID=A0A9Q1K1N4_9CARY|nr:hypothetical protein Cgig2_013672 [Carnegiea gigantea]
MASLNSLPFTLETRLESRFLVNSPSGSQFLEHQQRRALDFGGSVDSRSGIMKFMQHTVSSNHGRPSLRTVRSGGGYGRGGFWRSKHVRLAKGNDSVDGEDSQDAEDAIQATIEKSKKVLAMQRELLQQGSQSPENWSRSRWGGRGGGGGCEGDAGGVLCSCAGEECCAVEEGATAD